MNTDSSVILPSQIVALTPLVATPSGSPVRPGPVTRSRFKESLNFSASTSGMNNVANSPLLTTDEGTGRKRKITNESSGDARQRRAIEGHYFFPPSSPLGDGNLTLGQVTGNLGAYTNFDEVHPSAASETKIVSVADLVGKELPDDMWSHFIDFGRQIQALHEKKQCHGAINLSNLLLVTEKGKTVAELKDVESSLPPTFEVSDIFANTLYNSSEIYSSEELLKDVENINSSKELSKDVQDFIDSLSGVFLRGYNPEITERVLVWCLIEKALPSGQIQDGNMQAFKGSILKCLTMDEVRLFIQQQLIGIEWMSIDFACIILKLSALQTSMECLMHLKQKTNTYQRVGDTLELIDISTIDGVLQMLTTVQEHRDRLKFLAQERQLLEVQKKTLAPQELERLKNDMLKIWEPLQGDSSDSTSGSMHESSSVSE
jgi:hypothetical protein